MTIPIIRRAQGEHGAVPLSVRTRKRMLAALLELADDGDPRAMEALARLSFEVEIAAAVKPQSNADAAQAPEVAST